VQQLARECDGEVQLVVGGGRQGFFVLSWPRAAPLGYVFVRVMSRAYRAARLLTQLRGERA
jgi:hypothetical protein